MRTTYSSILFILIVVTVPTDVYARSDRIYLEESCPGLQSQEAALLVSALTSALIPQIIGGSLNVLSAKLDEAAEPEQTVATASIGDYLYEYVVKNGGKANPVLHGSGQIRLKHGCIIYVSGLVNPKEKWPKTEHQCGSEKKSSPLRDYGESGDQTCQLLEFFEEENYNLDYPPGTILVASIEVSKDKTAFRLKPNYLFYAASPDKDKKKVSSKKRKLAFNFTFSRPDPSDKSGREVFATPIIEFLDVAPGVIRARDDKNNNREEINIYDYAEVKHRASQWFAMPNVSSSIDALIDQDQSFQETFRTNGNSAYRAYSRTLLYKKDVEDFMRDSEKKEFKNCPKVTFDYIEENDDISTIDKLCDSSDDSTKWSTQLRLHQAKFWSIEQEISMLTDQLKNENDPAKKTNLRKELRYCNVAKTSEELWTEFASACQTTLSTADKRNEARLDALGIIEPIDVSLTVVEDHEKPFLKFVAGIFADESFRTELTDAITASIDPAKRAEAAEEKAEKRREAVAAYETAIIDAQKKEIDYDAIDITKKPFEKRKANIDMRMAKLKANRLADELDFALPFPSIGLALEFNSNMWD